MNGPPRSRLRRFAAPSRGSSSRLGTLRRERRLYLLFVLGVTMIGADAHAADTPVDKTNVLLWYDAFSKRDPALFDGILSKNWVDIPPAPDQPPGPSGAKQLRVELTTA